MQVAGDGSRTHLAVSILVDDANYFNNVLLCSHQSQYYSRGHETIGRMLPHDSSKTYACPGHMMLG
jgi:hypothetical protein